MAKASKKTDAPRKGRGHIHEKMKPWKPGQSGNPLGGKLHNPELRVIKNLTKTELVTVGNLIVKGDYVTLCALAADDSATVLQRMLASVAKKAIEQGDMQRLDGLLNRLIGKVKDEVEVSGTVPPQVIVTLPSNGREVKGI